MSAEVSQMQRIRDRYGVPAKRGMVVKFCGDDMVIVGTQRGTQRLRARCIATGNIWTMHPTWRVEYPEPTP